MKKKYLINSILVLLFFFNGSVIFSQINNRLDFIPNHSMDDVFKLIDNVDDNGFINDQSSYEPRKKWMSKLETNGPFRHRACNTCN